MTATNFPRCLAFTLRFEGGWSDNPHDPGAATMKGITLATYSARLGRQATKTELRNIPDQTVADIYRNEYWDKLRCDQRPAGIDLMLFDIAVNMGVGRAMQFSARMDRASNVASIHSLDRQRLGFWRSLRIFRYFGRGWIARETACLALALQMENGK